MKEIKFRAIPRYTNVCQHELSRMSQYDGTFIYGHLINNYIVGDVIEATDEYISLEYWVPIQKETVGQYTGLKDKNGTEIYVGDIVEYKQEWEVYPVGGIEIVKLTDGGFEPMSRKSGGAYYGLENSWYKIIGNIFDNPELLKTEGD